MQTNNFAEIAARIKAKVINRCKIGWFDHCSDSYDMRVVNARAIRILLRVRGERMTVREAMWGA